MWLRHCFRSLLEIAMKQPRKYLIAGLGAAIFAAVVALPQNLNGQAAAPVPPVAPAAAAAAAADAEAVAAIITEITDQQTKLAANQKLIDEKLAAIAENLRLAKLFVSRAGGGGAAK
jgi:hypothetical protein